MASFQPVPPIGAPSAQPDDDEDVFIPSSLGASPAAGITLKPTPAGAKPLAASRVHLEKPIEHEYNDPLTGERKLLKIQKTEGGRFEPEELKAISTFKKAYDEYIQFADKFKTDPRYFEYFQHAGQVLNRQIIRMTDNRFTISGCSRYSLESLGYKKSLSWKISSYPLVITFTKLDGRPPFQSNGPEQARCEAFFDQLDQYYSAGLATPYARESVPVKEMRSKLESQRIDLSTIGIRIKSRYDDDFLDLPKFAPTREREPMNLPPIRDPGKFAPGEQATEGYIALNRPAYHPPETLATDVKALIAEVDAEELPPMGKLDDEDSSEIIAPVAPPILPQPAPVSRGSRLWAAFVRALSGLRN